LPNEEYGATHLALLVEFRFLTQVSSKIKRRRRKGKGAWKNEKEWSVHFTQ
jgi:hypothetical protein